MLDFLLSQVEKFRDNVNEYRSLGNIKAVINDELLLFNYTAEATFSRNWPPLERICRGLVIDWTTATVVARGFEKFFNLNQVPETTTLPDLPFTITEKLDGSYISVFYHKDKLQVISKGSFDSTQAQWAYSHLLSNYSVHNFPTDCNLIFEAIYPENRIVVNYKNLEGLFLIGAVTPDGYDLTYQELETIADLYALQLVNQVEGDIFDLIDSTSTNIEGWVVRFENNLRVKIKTEEYRALHRIITHLSPKVIRDHLLYKTYSDFIVSLPVDIKLQVEEIAEVIQKEVYSRKAFYSNILKSIKFNNRKELAEKIVKDFLPYKAYLFTLHDGKDIDSLILKNLQLENLDLSFL